MGLYRAGLSRAHFSTNSVRDVSVDDVPATAPTTALLDASGFTRALSEAQLDKGRVMKLKILSLLLTLLTLSTQGVQGTSASEAITVFDISVVERRPFDRGTFTQGLLITSENLWVSSGLYGQSFVQRADWPSGENKRRLDLPDNLFAEGIAHHEGHLYLLTWRSRQMLALDPETLSVTAAHRLPGEGWGLTSDGTSLWMSDGTSRIREWRDGKFQRTLTVTLRGKPLSRLNELEWIDGEIWANVWMTDQIVTIAPTSGEITRIIDLTNLLPKSERARNTDVLNGIAHDPKANATWVTGKRWPYMYRIELLERK